MEFTRINLTKKNLISLPEGVFIESNVWDQGKSIYMAYVSPLDQREQQWRNIKNCKADGRIGNIFKSENEMIKYYEDRKARHAHFSIGKRVKLSKKIFLDLPEGSFIVSTIGSMGSDYSSKILGKDHREKQWQEIKKRNLDGRVFTILDTEEDKNEYTASMGKALKDQMNRKNID